MAGLVAAGLVLLPVAAGWHTATQAGLQQAKLTGLRAELVTTTTQAQQGAAVLHQQQAVAEASPGGVPPDGRTEAAPDGATALAHRQADVRAMQDLARLVFTWSDHDGYEAARTTLAEVHGASRDGRLLAEQVPADPVTTDAAGQRYSYLEAAGLNLHVVSARVWLVSDDGWRRTYTVAVEAAASRNGFTGEPLPVLLEASIVGESPPTEVGLTHTLTE